jgi:hypothetical protein
MTRVSAVLGLGIPAIVPGKKDVTDVRLVRGFDAELIVNQLIVMFRLAKLRSVSPADASFTLQEGRAMTALRSLVPGGRGERAGDVEVQAPSLVPANLLTKKAMALFVSPGAGRAASSWISAFSGLNSPRPQERLGLRCTRPLKVILRPCSTLH